MGLFAFAMVVIMGLLPVFLRSSANTSDTLTAVSFSDAVRLEMKRQVTLAGYSGFVSKVRNAPGGYAMVADRPGARLHAANDNLAADQVSNPEQYFHVSLVPFTAGALAYTDAKPYMAVIVLVSWPYRLPAASSSGYIEIPAESRESVSFNVVLNR